MSTDTILGIISAVMGVLALGLTIVGIYIGYVTVTLPKRVEEAVKQNVDDRVKMLESTMEVRLLLLDIVLQVTASTAAQIPNSEPERTKIYALQQVLRLTSPDNKEVLVALRAIEALGKDAADFLPYVERIAQHSNWSTDSRKAFDALLRKNFNKKELSS
jgi:hypothetical protein